MTFTYHLLQLPYIVLLALLVTLFGGISIIFTLLFKRHVPVVARRAHNEVVGYIFAMVGGLYGLLLGFVVFLVWGAFNTAQSDASREGSLARGLYRDIHYFPDTVAIAPLEADYVAYVQNAVNSEYPKMQRMQPLQRADRLAFSQLFKRVEKMDSNDQRINQMFMHLNELATYRSMRLLDGNSAIPVSIWVPLLLGALLVLLLASVLDIESTRLHGLLNGGLGAFIGLVFYLIILLDHPFSGQMRIYPEEYTRIMTMVNDD